MKKYIRLFVKIDDGAVTVDWVVLTAAIVGLGMVVLIPIGFSTTSSATAVGTQISGTSVGYGN